MTNKIAIGPDLVGMELTPHRWSWSERDAMLYALGIGARPDGDLPFVNEAYGPAVQPTFAVIPSTCAAQGAIEAIDIDLRNLLHGDQWLRLHRVVPPAAEVETTVRITDVWDKGKAAVIVWEFVTSDADGPIFTARSSSFVHGAGDFGGERGPRGSAFVMPDSAPGLELQEAISDRAAAIYRLSGDYNPIHIDPEFARSAGYERPFVHGLCTYGHVGRMLLQAMGEGDPARMAAFDVRFMSVVYPGQELTVKVWDAGDGGHLVQASTSNGVVIAGRLELRASAGRSEEPS